MFPARLLQLLRVSVLGAAIAFVQVPAWAAPDPAEFRLTPELLRKFEAIDAEGKRLAKAEEDDDSEADDDDADEADADDADEDKDEETVEDMARKMESEPQVKALLARHGMTPMQFALSAHALLHAGMYLAFEDAMDKQKAAELYRGYTKAQQANIELLRKSGMVKKK
jgi:hypothetical protein